MLKLVQTDWGRFDLAPCAAADEAGADMEAVQTLVYAALFTDAEHTGAPDAFVPQRFDRRGWWARPAAGSALWAVRRQPLTDAARQQAADLVRRALQTHAPVLADVHVSMDEGGHPARRNVSALVLAIKGQHNGRRFIVQVPL